MRRGLALSLILFPALLCALKAQEALPEQLAETTQAPNPDLAGLRRDRSKLKMPEDIPAKGHSAEEHFDIDPALDRSAVAAKREQYLSPGGRAWIETIMKRALPYQSYIMERIAYYGLPQELLYLPVVESEYRPGAVSRSGAAGMWQFMKNSVGGSAIVIDEWRDDRRDFMKSTEAALRKLKYNYEYYGDWHLAIGAYNCGVGAMNASIKKGGSRDFWVLAEKGALKAETKAYLPKFLAIASIARYGGRHGINLGWEEAQTWELIQLDRSVDIGIVAEKAGLAPEILRQGNAELRYNVTPPGGRSFGLKVPSAYAQRLREVLADPSNKLLKYHLYAIKSGDTLSALSRHYGVSIDMILSANPGLKANSLQINAKLVIPALKDVSPYEGRKVADPGLAFGESYRVKKGDSLWSISLKYGIAPEILAEKNGLNLSSIIREGQALKVPIIKEL